MQRHASPASSRRERSLGRTSFASAKLKTRSSILFELLCVLMFQPALRLHGCHATRAGSRDGLFEDRILDIAAREDARYIGARGVRSRPNIAALIQIDLALKNFSVRIMANRHKKTFNIQLRNVLG